MDTRIIGPLIWGIIHAIGYHEDKLKSVNQYFLHDFLLTLSYVFPCVCGENLRKYLIEHQDDLRNKNWLQQVYLLHCFVNRRLNRENINTTITFEVFKDRLEISSSLVKLSDLKDWIFMMVIGGAITKKKLSDILDHLMDLMTVYRQSEGSNFFKNAQILTEIESNATLQKLLDSLCQVFSWNVSAEDVMAQYRRAAVKKIPVNILSYQF